MRRVLLLAILLMCSTVYADDYKPYLHTATVPDHPGLVMYGQFETQLYPGAATYAYPIEVAPGRGIQPSISLLYNSQSNDPTSILGMGWSLTQNRIYRDIKGTVSDTSDDELVLVLDGIPYQLVYSEEDGRYHTEVEYHFKIVELEKSGSNNNYFLVTEKNGVSHRFGYASNSSLIGEEGDMLVWYLDTTEDTHNNIITYSYSVNPDASDKGAVYLTQIIYSTDRTILLSYEENPRKLLLYKEGIETQMAQRLSEVSVYAGNDFVRRYAFRYTEIGEASIGLTAISYFGNDNTSHLNTNFTYYESLPGYTNTSSWKIPVLFGNHTKDYGVRLLDFNRDGHIDLIQSNYTSEQLWISNKQGEWSNSTPDLPFRIVNKDKTNNAIRFLDLNKDGLVDVLQLNGSNKAYLNNGEEWDATNWIVPDVDARRPGVLVLDINKDMYPDVLVANESENTVYLSTGSGWFISTTWQLPLNISEDIDIGTRYIDVNNDGYIDALRASGNTDYNFSAWLNTGSGFVHSNVWIPPINFTDNNNEDTGVRFSDIDGDGLIDLQLGISDGASTEVSAWLNNGSGWVKRDAYNLSWFNVGNNSIDRRLADVNGDGFTDLLVANDDVNYTLLSPQKTPYLLKTIRNEYGALTWINYTPSTQFDNADEGLSQLGFNIFVVHNTTHSSMGQQRTRIFTYAQGSYNYENSEFRGFGKVKEFTTSKEIEHYFYQDNPRRGKEYKTNLIEDGNVRSTLLKDYNWTLKGSIYNVSLLYEIHTIDGKSSRVDYSYDGLENLRYKVEQGDISIFGDERYTNYTYAMNPTTWIMDRVSSKKIYDIYHEKAAQTRYFYDDVGFNAVEDHGDLTKVEYWISDGNYSHTSFEYDSYGNVVREVDSLGNSVDYLYDATNTFPEVSINQLGHITRSLFDNGTGNLIWSEQNDVRTSYAYDPFGRVLKEILPYDSSTYPTTYYSYDTDGVEPESIMISTRTTGNNYANTSHYYDGFGNLIQVKSDTTDGKQIVKNLYYDDEFRLSTEDNPYFANYSSEYTTSISTYDTTYTYDVLDRVTRVDNPDGTNKTITFDGWNVTDYDENGNIHEYGVNAYGQILSVIEWTDTPLVSGPLRSYETMYAYDTLGNLIEITDAQNNQFSFAYDNLGRKIRMDDPDMGTWTYRYDDNGNLISQSDNAGNTVTLTYDALNRITSKSYSENGSEKVINFTYDQNYLGTLSNVTVGGIAYGYTYDDRLRVIGLDKTIFDEILTTTYIYDSSDRLLAQARNGVQREFTYNDQDQITAISGFLTEATYTAHGVLDTKKLDNGITTSYIYEPSTLRLSTISTPGVQGLTYTYDNVGNILTLNDSQLSKQHTMTYDSLNRLVEASIGSDRYAYSYNELGNMMNIVRNNDSKKLVYTGSPAHAPSLIYDDKAGADIHHVHIDASSKNVSFNITLYNEKTISLSGVNLSINFGDGNTHNQNDLTITDSTNLLVHHAYSNGDTYNVQIQAFSPDSYDELNLTTRIGIQAAQLTKLHSAVDTHTFELLIENSMQETASDMYWNCSNSISSGIETDLLGSQYQYNFFQILFTTPGEHTLQCNITSSDGSDSISNKFTLPELDIDNYDTLSLDQGVKVIAYDLYNYFNSTQANLTVTSGEDSFQRPFNISTNSRIMSFAEFDYNSDGVKSLQIEASTPETNKNFKDEFTIQSIHITKYNRHPNQTISFDLHNTWEPGTVNWSIPIIGQSGSVILNHNETTTVSVSTNLTSEVDQLHLFASTNTTTDRITDRVTQNAIKILDFQAIPHSSSDAQFLLNISTDVGSVNWRIETGEQNLTGTSSGGLITTYANFTSSGVHLLKAELTSGAYTDSTRGVFIK